MSTHTMNKGYGDGFSGEPKNPMYANDKDYAVGYALGKCDRGDRKAHLRKTHKKPKAEV